MFEYGAFVCVFRGGALPYTLNYVESSYLALESELVGGR